MANEIYRELILTADKDKLPEVIDFVDAGLEELGCSLKTQMQIDVAVEELFVNVASYAYAPGSGSVTVRTLTTPDAIAITFIDSGVPYDPLAKPDPDVTLPADERAIGGLGIFMTKKMMDDVSYEYIDGKNTLTIKKNL